MGLFETLGEAMNPYPEKGLPKNVGTHPKITEEQIAVFWTDFYLENDLSEKEIFDFFKLHFNPGSIAVEFGKWLLDHCGFTDSEEGPRQWFRYGKDVPATTEELYKEFKKLK